MLVSLILLAVLSIAAIVGSVVVTRRDGHRRIPTSSYYWHALRVDR